MHTIYTIGHSTRSSQLTACLKAGACVWTPPQLGIPRQACRFGFSVRHIGAYRQDTRPCPVLPDKERSHRDIPGTHQISMERVMTVLTDEQQAFVGAVGLSGIPTYRAGFAGVVGIDFDGHTAGQEGFVGNHALQFSKGPFGVGCIGLALLQASLFACLAVGAFADVCQVFQADEAVRVLLDDAFGHDNWHLASTVSPVHSGRGVAVSRNGCLSDADAFSDAHNGWLWEPRPFPYEKSMLPG